MKLIVAIIKAEDLGAVEATLDRRLNCLMSVTPMRGYGPEPCMAGVFRGVRYRVRSTYLKLEVAVADDLVAAAAAVIHGATRDPGFDSSVEPTVSVLHLEECGQPWSGG